MSPRKPIRLAVIGVILATLILLPGDQTRAQTAEVENCTSDVLNNCTTRGWIVANHACRWHGLSLDCTDYEAELCFPAAGEKCYTKNTREVAGAFQIADAVTQFVRLSQWGLGIVGALAALMFVWAGWQFLTAAGRSSQVDEGKRIITGTITGLIISFSAYVIVNFAVIALTGQTAVTKDVFGPLGILFPCDPKKDPTCDKSLTKPFGGSSKDLENRTNCRSTTNTLWEKGCSDRVLCADPGTGTDGEVATLQRKLNALNCGCGAVDGCFGPVTVDCVRKFQLANDLPPTGVMDATSTAVLNRPGPMTALACDNPSTGPAASAVMSNLPKAVLPDETDLSTAPDSGCCIVSDGTDDLYCLENVTALTCVTLNGREGNEFLTGKSCAGSETSNRCGSCKSAEVYSMGADNNCFEFATPRWCQSYARDSNGDPLNFQPYTCKFTCPEQGGVCRPTLMTTLR